MNTPFCSASLACRGVATRLLAFRGRGGVGSHKLAPFVGAACAQTFSFQAITTSSHPPRPQVMVSEYLATRLREAHCDHVFSVAGSYSTEFLDGMGEASAGPNMQRLKRVANTNEMEASYAAEGYAKARGGVGAICVSYGAGLLGTVNGITGAHIERVPLVVINGAPTDQQYRQFTENDVMPYHAMYQQREADKRVFTPITCEQAVLGNRAQIPLQIDAAFQAALTTRQPIYIEVSRNQFTQLVDAPIPGKLITTGAMFDDDPQQVEAAADMAWQGLQRSKRPLLYAGAELVRYGCDDLFAQLVQRSHIMWITDTAAKSMLSEHNPLFAGVFCGKMSDPSTLQYVQEKDFVLQLGVWSGQLSTAGYPVDQFLNGCTQYVLARHNAVIGHDRRVMGAVSLKGLLTALVAKFKAEPALPVRPAWQISRAMLPTAVDERQQPSFDSFRALLSEARALLEECVVCVDATFGFLSCLSLPVTQHQWFNQTTYAIIGWSSGAAVGIGLALKAQRKKVLVLVGDGGLMNCPTGVSTSVQQGLDIIYCVFDNRVYAVDQFFADTKPFKDPTVPFTGAHQLPTWDWVKMATAWGATGHLAKTNGELKAILRQLEKASGTHVVQISINAHAFPQNLKSLIS